MDVHDQLNHLEATVRGAKAMPMSTSCLVNRAEMLEMVGRLRGALPANLDHANAVLSERDAVLAAGRLQAERIVKTARLEREQLIAESEVLVVARGRAGELITQAREESTRLLTDADRYVDRKLAEFEVLLGQLGSQVNNGRLRLTTRRQADLAHFHEAADRVPPSVVHRQDEPAEGPPESAASQDSGAVDQQSTLASDVSLGTR
ncbi:MAG: hypothetical protein H7270_04495 [Dermatophilaceae bacterium]|nr:hypothetical protein [Dermatophilaceae bacterium]